MSQQEPSALPLLRAGAVWSGRRSGRGEDDGLVPDRHLQTVAGPVRRIVGRNRLSAEATYWPLTSAGVGLPTGSPTLSPEPNPLQQPLKPNPPIPRLTEGGGL